MKRQVIQLVSNMIKFNFCVTKQVSNYHLAGIANKIIIQFLKIPL